MLKIEKLRNGLTQYAAPALRRNCRCFIAGLLVVLLLAPCGGYLSVGASGTQNPSDLFGPVQGTFPKFRIIPAVEQDFSLQIALSRAGIQPVALASADMNQDGIPDLICGYSSGEEGWISLSFGKRKAIYPGSRPAVQNWPNAPQWTPFQSGPLLTIPSVPDFLEAGDFDGDGNPDVVIAAQGDSVLYFLRGQSVAGILGVPEEIQLAGRLDSLVAGQFNRRDGLTDLAIATSGDNGSEVRVFQGPRGALASDGWSFELPGPASGLALGRFDGDALYDLSAAAGNVLVMAKGWDDAFEDRQSSFPRLTDLKARIVALAAGDFSDEPLGRTDLAALDELGALRLFHFLDDGEREPWLEQVGEVRLGMQSWHRQTDRKRRASLFRAVMTASAGDDLVLLDTSQQRLQLLPSSPSVLFAELDEQRSPGLSLEIRQPTAALAMRLNPDGLSDLVITQSGSTMPSVVLTQFAATLVVNSNGDGVDVNSPRGVCSDGTGHCTLRAALFQAARIAGSILIAFDLPPGQTTIQPQSPLPPVRSATTIDGTTQPGFDGFPVVELNGALIPSSRVDGLVVSGRGAIVRGLSITGFTGDAIEIRGLGDNFIEGNFLGLAPDGQTAKGNQREGVNVEFSENNVIGGTVFEARNVISGNIDNGIEISDPESINNRISGNFIGTDASGAFAVPNQARGISFFGPRDNMIGGPDTSHRNLISGNRLEGIVILDDKSRNNLLMSNWIGVDVTGVQLLPNQRAGLFSKALNTIGGFAPQPGFPPGNLILGNAGGVACLDQNVLRGNVISLNGGGVALNRGNVVQGNAIGSDALGLVQMGNRGAGVTTFVGNNRIGGVLPDEANIIAFNSGSGVEVDNSNDTGNTIRGNAIFKNGRLGIDLIPRGVTPNDPLDADSGPNNLQNFPEILSAQASLDSTRIIAQLHSSPNSSFIVDFYGNRACEESSLTQGRHWLGSISATTDDGGNAIFTAEVGPLENQNGAVTATATAEDGSTSEFSSCLLSVPSNQPPLAICRDLTLEADASCKASVEAGEVGPESFDPDGDPLTFRLDPPSPFALGENSVLLTVSDSVASDSCSAKIEVTDNSPPIPSLAVLPTIQGECLVEVATRPTAADNCQGSIEGTTEDPLTYDDIGIFQITWDYCDQNQNCSSQEQAVAVEDATPPVIEQLSASPQVLWPPNGAWRTVVVAPLVVDNCNERVGCLIVSVSSNEADDGIGDGRTSPDWEIVDDLSVNLRAERSGLGSNRIYTIEVHCVDFGGNQSIGTVDIVVPHDQRLQ